MTATDPAEIFRDSLLDDLEFQIAHVWRDGIGVKMFDAGAKYARRYFASCDPVIAISALRHVLAFDPPEVSPDERVVQLPIANIEDAIQQIQLIDCLKSVLSLDEVGVGLARGACRSASQLRGFLAKLAELTAEAMGMEVQR